MKETVNDVIRLAEAAHPRIEHRLDTGEDDDLSMVLGEKSEATQNLEEYLRKLPVALTRRLQALMYFGRRDDHDLLRLEAALKSSKRVELVILSMVEKVPLAEYLRNGLALAETTIDLEAWQRGELHYVEPPPRVRAPHTGATFQLTPPTDADPFTHGGEILVRLADEWSAPIVPLSDVEAFFTKLKARTGGNVIVDFIDLGNWDALVGHEFDLATGDLVLYWRDYRSDSDSDSNTEDRMAFPGDVYALYIHLQEIRIVRGDSFAMFLLKGYATTPNQAKKRLRAGAKDFFQREEAAFSSQVVRVVNDRTHVIDVHGAPLYTIAVVPKGEHIDGGTSRRVLFAFNLDTLKARLRDAMSGLMTAPSDAADLICEKSNTVRRIVEQALKLEIVLRDVHATKPYAQLALGELLGLLREHHEEPLRAAFNKIAGLANEMSHDSGGRVELTQAKGLALLVHHYLEYLTLEIDSRDDLPRAG